MIYTHSLDLSEYCYGEQRKGLFVSITSLGYLDYTLNLIKSVERLGFSRYLVVFALDAEGYNALLKEASGAGVGVVVLLEGLDAHTGSISAKDFQLIMTGIKSHLLTSMGEGGEGRD